jgi:hypothetical protein
MIKEYFGMIPLIIVALGYPISVYYVSKSFDIAVFFSFGFLLVSFSMMLLVWLPTSEGLFPSNARLSQSSFSDPPKIFPKKKYRAEDIFSSGIEPNSYVEKRYQEEMSFPIPPKAPINPNFRPETQVLRVEIVDLSTPKRESFYVEEPKDETEEIIMNKEKINEVLESSFKKELGKDENTPKERKVVTLNKDPFGYCHDCKKVQPVINAEITEISTSKGIKRFVKGNCQICGRIIKGLLALRD